MAHDKVLAFEEAVVTVSKQRERNDAESVFATPPNKASSTTGRKSYSTTPA